MTSRAFSKAFDMQDVSAVREAALPGAREVTLSDYSMKDHRLAPEPSPVRVGRAAPPPPGPQAGAQARIDGTLPGPKWPPYVVGVVDGELVYAPRRRVPDEDSLEWQQLLYGAPVEICGKTHGSFLVPELPPLFPGFPKACLPDVCCVIEFPKFELLIGVTIDDVIVDGVVNPLNVRSLAWAMSKQLVDGGRVVKTHRGWGVRR